MYMSYFLIDHNRESLIFITIVCFRTLDKHKRVLLQNLISDTFSMDFNLLPVDMTNSPILKKHHNMLE